ncbi:ROK family protein [Actinospica robiniae]|uniref:ROK family protein n=1 Tax=Actinospica robiniae TaxID=304901 RepID=UPI00040E2F96|nr:ROK family protein [Actinospica robiniae]
MNADADSVVATMDIGGTHVTAAHVAVGSRAVVPGRSCRLPLDSHAAAEEIVGVLVECASRLPALPGNRWAIALPGPFDYEEGIGRYTGVGKFDALNGYDLGAALAARLHTDASALSFHHDAEAFLAGEWWAGAASGHETAAGFTLGTGVGSAFLHEGRSVREGPGIPPGGRVDLLRFEGRPLEETVSRQALRQAYAEQTGEPEPPDVRGIAERARRGEQAARVVFTETFRVLGSVLAPCLAQFQPSIVVVGGSIARAWDLVAGPLRAGLETGGVVGTQLELAQLGDAAALLGAAAMAREAVLG